MTTSATNSLSRPLLHHVAVIGAAGGLGQGILSVCRAEGVGFTAIVRARPERITDVPPGEIRALGGKNQPTAGISYGLEEF